MTAAALKPFVKALGELEPEVAKAMSPWLPRLSLLVGALARTQHAGGDPDGYEGVAPRGRYERLLLSEWAVALELPEEFVRRAVMNEHLFVEIKRREPQGALHSLVLVDPGPDQLGAPRLLHLAAAIVGEARAKRAKAAFAWGATTEPVRLFSQVDPESARLVLDARRATPLTAASLERWHAAVRRFDAPASDDVTPVVRWRPSSGPAPGAHPPACSSAPPSSSRAAAPPPQVDVLFVGGAHLEELVAASPFAGHARVLRVDAAAAALEASIRPSARPRPVSLPLPDDALAVRALRDPFGVQAKKSPVPVVDVVARGGLVVPLGGRRILVRTTTGVAALIAPNSPRAPLAPPRHVPLEKDDVVLAAGMVGKRVLVVARDAAGLVVVFGFGNGAAERYRVKGEVYPHLDGDPIDGTFVPADDHVRPLHVMPDGIVVIDPDDTLNAIPGVGPVPRGFLDEDVGRAASRGYALLPFHRRVAELPDGHAIAPLLYKGDALTVQREADDRDVVVRVNAARRKLSFGGQLRHAFLGAFRANGLVPGALALGMSSGAWALVQGVSDEPPLIGQAPWGVDVVGAAHHPDAGPVLLGVEQRRRLVIASKRAREDDLFSVIERHSFASDIMEVKPDLELPQVAVLTEDGAVTLLYLKTGVRSLLCRRGPA